MGGWADRLCRGIVGLEMWDGGVHKLGRLICASRDMRVVGLTSFVMAVSTYVVRLGEALENPQRTCITRTTGML